MLTVPPPFLDEHPCTTPTTHNTPSIQRYGFIISLSYYFIFSNSPFAFLAKEESGKLEITSVKKGLASDFFPSSTKDIPCLYNASGTWESFGYFSLNSSNFKMAS